MRLKIFSTQLGRWHSIDKLAENYLSQSPYSYAGNNPINYVDLYGLWFDNAKPAPEGGGSGGAGAEPFDWAGAWNTYQLIYGDNGGYSGSGTRGINMSSPTGDTFAGHGAGISGYGYSKVRSNGGNSSLATSFMAQPPDGGDPPYAINIYFEGDVEPALILTNSVGYDTDVYLDVTNPIPNSGTQTVNIDDLLIISPDADATMTSIYLGAAAGPAVGFSLDLVTILSGPSQGETHLYYSYHMGVGVGVGISVGAYEIYKDPDFDIHNFDFTAFTGWGHSVGGGFLIFEASFVEGYSDRKEFFGKKNRIYKGYSVGLSKGYPNFTLTPFMTSKTKYIKPLIQN